MRNNAVLKRNKSINKNCVSNYALLGCSILKVLILTTTIILSIIVKESTQIKWALFYLLTLNIYLVVINYKCTYALIISLFLLWFNYSIYFASYIYELENLFTSWAYSNVAVSGYKIILIFTTVLCVFIKVGNFAENIEIQNGNKPKLLNDDQPSYAIFSYCYLILLALLLVFGFGRPTESGVRGTTSTYYEYSTIVFIVGFYFFKWNKIYRYCSIILLMLFALQNMLYGGRVTALQLLIILFVVIFDGRKIPWRKLLPIFVLALISFSLIGIMRANVQFSLKNLYDTFIELTMEGYL